MQEFSQETSRTAASSRIRTLIKWFVRVCLLVLLLMMLGFIWLLSNFTGETSIPPKRIMSSLTKIGVPQLREDAQNALNHFANHSTASWEIPEQYWTESIKIFHPVRVRKHGNGLNVIVKKNFRYLNGIIIYTTIPEDVQMSAIGDSVTGGSGYGEYKIAQGVCWYWEKIRSPRRRVISSHFPQQRQEIDWATYFSGTENFPSMTTLPVGFPQRFQGYSALSVTSTEPKDMPDDKNIGRNTFQHEHNISQEGKDMD